MYSTFEEGTRGRRIEKKTDKRECRYYTLDHMRGDTWTATPIKFSKTNLLFTTEVPYQGLPIHGHGVSPPSPLHFPLLSSPLAPP